MQVMGCEARRILCFKSGTMAEITTRTPLSYTCTLYNCATGELILDPNEYCCKAYVVAWFGFFWQLAHDTTSKLFFDLSAVKEMLKYSKRTLSSSLVGLIHKTTS